MVYAVSEPSIQFVEPPGAVIIAYILQNPTPLESEHVWQ